MTDQASASGQRPTAHDGLSFRKLSRVRPAAGPTANRFELFERFFVIFSVAVFLGLSNLGRTTDPSDVNGGQHNTLNTVLYCGIIGISSILLLLRRREVAPVVANSKLIWIYLAWVAASVLWSIDPDLAVRRVILYSATVLLALYAASRFDPSTAIKLAGWAYFWSIVASTLVAIFLPRIGVMHDTAAAARWADLTDGAKLEGDWAGIFGHKNVLGFATIANAQIFAWRWYIEKNKRWLFTPIILLGIFVTYKTHSATSALLVALTLVTYLFLHVSRRAASVRALLVFSAAVVATAVATAALLLPDEFTALVGKDATLTGRVPIWHVLLRDVIPTHPIFGYGFNTFFVLNNPDYLRLMDIVGWPAPHAHNGYLNLAVEIGIPGAALATFILLRLIVGAVRLVNDERAPWMAHVLVFGITFAFLNMVESSLLRISDNWAFAMQFCCFALWKYQAEIRPKAAPTERGWGNFTSIRHTNVKHTELP